MARVLVSTFGSAGDLFPLVPVMDGLRATGADVRCAAPGALALLMRGMGAKTLVLGEGAEFAVLRDQQIFDTRFDGWSSWRRTLVSYVEPALADGVRRLEATFDRWRPDVVVTSGFAVAARVAAHRRDVPTVELSIYPQHQGVGAGTHLARSTVRAVRALAGADAPVDRLLWGAPCDALFHDEALLGGGSERRPVGYPYWDHVPGTGDVPAAVGTFLARPGPRVALTLGSFIGHARGMQWREVATSLVAAGASVLVVGASGADVGADDRVTCTGFVPLSLVLPGVDVVVHHGGLGTTMAALRAGVPAVVVPQAFDQSFTARLVVSAGCGTVAWAADPGAIGAAIQEVLDDPRFGTAVRATRDALVAPGAAAAVAVGLVEGVV